MLQRIRNALVRESIFKDVSFETILAYETKNENQMSRYRSTETSVLQFFGDDFLRLLVVRYVFCDVVLNLHRSFRGRQQRPRCHPPLPDAEVLEHPNLHHLVFELAACLDCRDHFPDSNELA